MDKLQRGSKRHHIKNSKEVRAMKPGYSLKLIISDILSVISTICLLTVTNTNILLVSVVWLLYSLISFVSTYEQWNKLSRE
jgi:ABC-type bacteriocin/lantibiotic exporter with double-glycine peptidase domain